MNRSCFLMALLFGLSFSTWLSQAQACDRAINPNKVVFFIDVNASLIEVKQAQAAACLRGQRLVVFPESYQARGQLHEEIMPIIEYYEQHECYVDSSTPNCKNVNAKIEQAEQKFKPFGLRFKLKDLERKLKQIKQSKAIIETIIVSGHATDGSFNGDGPLDASIGSDVIAELFTAHNFNETVRDIYLWGCYTVTRYEVDRWVGNFPKTQLLVGFSGQAPLSMLPASPQMLLSSMVKASSILQTRNTGDLQFYINGISHILDTNSAIYVRPLEQGYYWEPGSLTKYGAFDCQLVKSSLGPKRALWEKYYQGTLPIPSNAHEGPLRELYNFLRYNQHCLQPSDQMPSADQAVNLLFFSKVTENFTAYLRQWPSKFSKWTGQDGQAAFNKLVLFGLSPAQAKSFWIPSDEHYFANSEQLYNRKEIIKNLNNMAQVIAQLPPVKQNLVDPHYALRKLYYAMDTYLVQLKCIKGWHEYSRNAPVPSC